MKRWNRLVSESFAKTLIAFLLHFFHPLQLSRCKCRLTFEWSSSKNVFVSTRMSTGGSRPRCKLSALFNTISNTFEMTHKEQSRKTSFQQIFHNASRERAAWIIRKENGGLKVVSSFLMSPWCNSSSFHFSRLAPSLSIFSIDGKIFITLCFCVNKLCTISVNFISCANSGANNDNVCYLVILWRKILWNSEWGSVMSSDATFAPNLYFFPEAANLHLKRVRKRKSLRRSRRRRKSLLLR